jgi:hypothetical protein
MSSDRLMQEWNSYLEAVVPKGASEAQRLNTMNTFFAGALAAFRLMVDGTGISKTQEGQKVVADMCGEFERHIQILAQLQANRGKGSA